MQYPSLLLLPDKSIGDISLKSLSDQALMEALIDKTSDDFKKMYQDPSGEYLPVCRWQGVKCNKRREVVEIKRGCFNLYCADEKLAVPTELELRYLPPRIRVFEIGGSDFFYGTVETRLLPNRLEDFYLRQENFTGTFDFRNLPERLERLGIDLNDFHGPCDLKRLPGGLRDLRAICNRFTGSLALDSLPRSFEILKLSDNQLSGLLNLKKLPRAMRILDLRINQFHGEVCFDYLPSKIEEVDLSRNRLCWSIRVVNLPESLKILNLAENDYAGTAVISKNLKSRVNFSSRYVQAVADENGLVYERFDQVTARGFKEELQNMVRFVNDLHPDSKRKFQDEKGEFLPLQKWPGIKLSSQWRIWQIFFTTENGFQGLKGSFAFEHMPDQVSACILGGERNTIHGTIEAARIPRLMTLIRISRSYFTGTLQFECLPMRLRCFNFAKNKFTGTVALDRLPLDLEILSAGDNEFDGSLDLTKLPKKMKILELEENNFVGTVCLNLLPQSLTIINLADNQLHGSMRMMQVLPNFERCSIYGNKFSGTSFFARGVCDKVEYDFDLEFVDAKGFVASHHATGCDEKRN